MRKLLRRFFRNPGAVLGLGLLGVLVGLALVGPAFAGVPLAQNLGVRLRP
ncbi:hypothetical protein, partial [Klebsiella pneumoniae]